MNLTTAWLKSYVRYPLDVRRAERYLASAATKPLPTSGTSHRSIVVDMYTPQLLFDCGRHLNCIATHARHANSRFYLRCSKVLLAGIARKLYGRELLSSPGLTWLSPRESYPADALVLTDDAGRCDDENAIAMFIGRDVAAASPVMPYPMHHRTIESLPTLDFSAHRDTKERRGVFFAGRIKDSYKRNDVQNEFSVIDRVHAITTLQSHFEGRVFPTLDAANDAKASNPIVLQDSSLHSIDSSQWLHTLAQFNVFLCCPGASQPMCHNAIEAMSVGTIPLLEYSNRFTPHLEDSVNSICFEGPSGLIEAIERIDRMSDQEIARLRAGVADYFDNHLRGDRFLAKLRDGEFGAGTQIVSMPFHSRNYFKAA